MERYLAHHIIHQGHHYKLSLLSIECCDGLYRVHIEPFTQETPGTEFHNGTIAVCARSCSPAQVQNHPYEPSAQPPVLVFFDVAL